MSDELKRPTINVTSNHQSGGITAHTVNLNPTYQRILGDVVRSSLIESVPRDKLVVVWAVNGDEESFNLAREIFDFLKKSGFNLFGNGPAGQIYVQPFYGLQVDMGKHTEIRVGLMSAAEKAAARGERL